jgi:antitoxin component YwqK of YwqJK toxin-antitoxin module
MSAFLWGSEIKKSEINLKNSLIYKIGEPIPFTGKLKDIYANGTTEYEFEVTSGVIRNFKKYQEDGKTIFDGKLDGNKLTGKAWEYFPDGQHKLDIDFVLDLTQSIDLQELIAQRGQMSEFPMELINRVNQNDKMHLIYREYLPGSERKEKNNTEIQWVDGLLVGKGTGIYSEVAGTKFNFQFQIENLQKLNFDKISKWRENPLNINFNEIVTEIVNVIKIKEFLTEITDVNNSTQVLVNLNLESGKLVGTYKGEIDKTIPKAKFTIQLDKLTDVDWNAIIAAKMNANPLVGVTAIIAEVAKFKNVVISTEMIQNNKPLQTKISLISGKLDIISDILYNSGKPHGRLIVRINNIRAIDLNKINPQDPNGMIQVFGITGEYIEYNENGKEIDKATLTPNTSTVILQKMTSLMQ